MNSIQNCICYDCVQVTLDEFSFILILQCNIEPNSYDTTLCCLCIDENVKSRENIIGSKTVSQANLLIKSGESGYLCETVKYIHIQTDFSQNGVHVISTVLLTSLDF